MPRPLNYMKRNMTPKEKYDILVAYCKMKIEARDWHAVSDAANDIRELLARYPEIENKDLSKSP